MQRETARRHETAGGVAENILRRQNIGDELFQVVRRLRLHAGGNFLGKKLKQKIGHHIHAKPRLGSRGASSALSGQMKSSGR